MRPADDELGPSLAEVLGAREVSAVERLSGGASRETWAFEAELAGVARRLILQRERPGGLREGGMGIEAAVLRAAGAAGVPVPSVIACDDGRGGGPLGPAYLVVERLEGESIARRILREDALADARAVLAGHCGAALAGIHAIDPAEVPGLEDVDQLHRYRQVLDDLAQPHPAFELAFRWLADHRPPGAGRTVVHGDFRNGNLLVGPCGLVAVLDWELAHLGDPLEDLGWLCVRSWRFGAGPRVGGFGTVDDLVAAYEAAGGTEVDRAALHWWELLGTLKWGIMCVAQAETHRLGVVRSVELAAIGRRVCEVEHDVLLLLAGSGGSPVPADGGPVAVRQVEVLVGPHDVPSAAELLDAVREFLTDDVMAATEGRVRFHARVAANVVATVARELELGLAQAQRHARRLLELGVDDDAELARRIRTGDLDERWDEVVAAVGQAVADKLAVANPSYASPSDSGPSGSGPSGSGPSGSGVS